jgi:hypothetical protein
MEQNDITPVNGSWLQDSAYTLRRLEDINKVLLNQVSENNKIIETISSAITQSNSGSTCDTAKTINIEFNKTIMGKPDVYYVHTPQPQKCPKPPQVNVSHKTTVLQPPPIKRVVSDVRIQLKICGDLKNHKCLKCVDNWLLANKVFTEKDLTQERTGCKNPILMEKCQELATNIVDRAAMKRYYDCLERNRQKEALKRSGKY